MKQILSILTLWASSQQIQFYFTIPQVDEDALDIGLGNSNCQVASTTQANKVSTNNGDETIHQSTALTQSIVVSRMDIDNEQVLLMTHPMTTSATTFTTTDCGLYLKGLTNVSGDNLINIMDIDDKVDHPKVSSCFRKDGTSMPGADSLCPQFYNQPCSTTLKYCANGYECSDRNQVCAYPLPKTLNLATLQVTFPIGVHYQSQKAANFFIFLDEYLRTSIPCQYRNSYHYLSPANTQGNSVWIYWEPNEGEVCSIDIITSLVTNAWSTVTPPFPSDTKPEIIAKAAISVNSYTVGDIGQDQIKACVNDVYNTLACLSYDVTCQIKCGDAIACTSDAHCGSNRCAPVSPSSNIMSKHAYDNTHMGMNLDDESEDGEGDELPSSPSNPHYYDEDDDYENSFFQQADVSNNPTTTTPTNADPALPRACASDCYTVIIAPAFYVAVLAMSAFLG